MTNENALLAERIAMYYRQPERTSYFDKEIYFEVITNNPEIHFEALNINRQIWEKRKKRKNKR
ncbi:hypothetical protein J2Z76_001713 [Sedimentibacter acidaminivorans]|uniref:Uncharacterized protein n=1 Tax=Sedimentibacter acidaminivorans TaxID=913099 RepID=A0ABS4GDS2_9FIRM|nr:hypothetical protein [Sedimentibacter acidaminivorans]MBP1925852.1 hypothetical protein [Sedimentibacter acidaminivorans]